MYIQRRKIESFFITQFPVISGSTKTTDDQGLTALEKAFEILDSYLEESDYVAGDHLTIADFSIVVTVSTVDVSSSKWYLIFYEFKLLSF